MIARRALVLLSRQASRSSCLHVCRHPSQITAPSCRLYSDKVLEGMGEYVEEEEEYDISLLDEPFARLPTEHPPWRQTRGWYARQYATHGKASGVDPAIMWPTKEELCKLKEEEAIYFQSLQEMQAELAAEKREADLAELKREKMIAANMAKMPQMIADYRKKVQEHKDQLEAQQAKRAKLLAMAKEKLGYAIDPRSPRFKQMVEEIEAEEKKRRKELKKRGIKV
ncbi:uncharacterized protein [Diadema setosum]|uniref:uncharacterized protein n=1 Tax=Diadema setosum TaxID=31175 RepID=UPI003B3AD28F